jgi:hypothetical protein
MGVGCHAQLTWLMPEIRASQDLANALWALATVAPILRRPLSQEALADLSGPWADTALALFTCSDENGAPLIQPQQCPTSLWAYAQLRVSCSPPSVYLLTDRKESSEFGLPKIYMIIVTQTPVVNAATRKSKVGLPLNLPSL